MKTPEKVYIDDFGSGFSINAMHIDSIEKV